MEQDKDLDTGLPKRLERRFVPPATDSLIRSILACKWTLTVFQLLRAEVRRPGAMVASVDGLSTKSLNDCMRRLVNFDLVQRHAFAEVPPRVEYQLTERGEQVASLFDRILELDRDSAAE